MLLRPVRLMLFVLLALAPLPLMAAAKPKVHVLSFGKTIAVKLYLGPDEEHSVPMKVRALYVDTKQKDFVTGEIHEVTERLFVVRRAYRLNNRDYVAYCGVSDNGQKLSAVVMQLGRKKPVLKKELGAANHGEMPDSECDAPTWEKKPTRVTFLPKRGEKQAFSIFGHAWDSAPGSDEE